MHGLERTLEILERTLPFLAVGAVMVVALLGLRWILLRSARDIGEGRLGRQLVMVTLTCAAIVLFVLVVPIEDSTRSDLLNLLGILLSATIAFASTTFVANAMAGIMLRSVGNFKAGDFLRVGEAFGRVTERGLFHVEIQTEDRDLATLPNMLLVTNPVTVVSASGTIVSATLSLGYDEPHSRLEPLMIEAARAADLADPFVHVLDLGDFAVTYRVAGFLADVTTLLSARSRLRRRLLDTLHDAGVEIVSPTFMNQRQIPQEMVFVPPAMQPDRDDDDAETTSEQLVFDKAEAAAAREARVEERARLEAQIAACEKRGDGDEEEAQAGLAALRARLAELDAADVTGDTSG